MDARDVMTVPVRTVGPDASVEEIVRLLLDNQISAVPVVDRDGHVIGMVSEGDLCRRTELGTEPRRSWWLTQLLEPGRGAHDLAKAHGHSAAEIMTRDVVSVSEDTPVSEIADLLESCGIKRVPVLRDGRLVGIVSRANFLRTLATRPKDELPVTPSDRALRDAILDVLREQPWSSCRRIHVSVDHATVTLWGIAMSRTEHDALCAAVKSQPGVAGLVDRITDFPDFPWKAA